MNPPRQHFTPSANQADGSVQVDADAVDSNQTSEPPLVSESTADLAVRAQAGSADAFAQLTEHLRPRLVSYLHKQLGNLQDAEDVAQDSITRAWQGIAKYDPRYQFTTWLYVIAKRRATDLQRRHRRTTTSNVQLDLNQIPDAPDSSQPGQVINLWSIAHRCLSADQYGLLWLRYGEELSLPDIARVMDRSKVSIRVQLHRARKSLKLKWKEYRFQNQDEEAASDSRSTQARTTDLGPTDAKTEPIHEP